MDYLDERKNGAATSSIVQDSPTKTQDSPRYIFVRYYDHEGNNLSHYDAYEAPLLYDLDQRTAFLEQFAQRYPQIWELLNYSIGELRVVQNIWPTHNAEAMPVELKCFALWFTVIDRFIFPGS